MPESTRWCNKHKCEHPISEFTSNRTTHDGLEVYCRATKREYNQTHAAKPTTKQTLRAYRETHRHQHNVAQRKWRYNLTEAQHLAKVAAQDNKCMICRGAETATRNGVVRVLAVDHDHATKVVRDLLCHVCNLGLGAFRDSPTLLRIAADYLERHGVVDVYSHMLLGADDTLVDFRTLHLPA